MLFIHLLPASLLAKGNDFYSVQTGSFATDSIAIKQYEDLLKSLHGKELEHLRIEKIGAFYAVRIGNFRDYALADKFLQDRATQLEGAIVLKVTYNDERIVRQYTTGTSINRMEDHDNPVSPEKPGIASTMETSTMTSHQYEIKRNSNKPANAEVTNDHFGVSRPSPLVAPEKKIIKQSNIRGRFYISDYYSNDSNNFDFHVLSTRLKVYKRESDNSRYYFTLDARARKKVSDNDVHNKIPEYKFYEAWVGYKFPRQNIDLIAGRQYVHEMFNTSVDGINAKYSLSDDLGIGIFAGLAPDKYDYSFNSKFKTAGIYSYLNKDSFKLNLGFEKLYYEGDTDREYFSFKLFSNPAQQTSFNLLSSASINQISNNIDIDNLSAMLIHKYSNDLRFNVFFNYYSAIRYFESSKKFFTQNGGSDSYYLDTNSQARIGLRVNYRISKKLTIYTSLAYQKRDIDNESATRFTGGLRMYDLYGFDLSGRYTRINNFTSKSNEFNVEVSRFVLEKFDLSVYASHEQEELEIENGFTAGLLTYGASVYWSINKHFYASMFIERYDEDDYDNTSIFTQAGYRF